MKRESPKPEVGFEIQGLQYSQKFLRNCIKDIVIQTINSKEERGDHFHKEKLEWFMALEGEAEIIWKEIGSKDVHRWAFKTDFQNPYIYKIEPNTCHRVENNTDRPFLMATFSTVEFDKENPDNPKCKPEE